MRRCAWITGSILLGVVLWALAIGPVCVLMQRGWLPPRALVLYAPICSEDGIRPAWLEEPVMRYILAWGRLTHTAME